jgi:hypothetical protein
VRSKVITVAQIRLAGDLWRERVNWPCIMQRWQTDGLALLELIRFSVGGVRSPLA